MSTNDKQLNLAFAVAPREAFLAPDQVEFAKRDMPLQIGYSQTNSQPTLVRTMLKWLDVKPGQKILDVGSGSAWTSALLAHLTGKGGQVYAVEIVKELLDFGQKNCQKLGKKTSLSTKHTTNLVLLSSLRMTAYWLALAQPVYRKYLLIS